MYEHGLHVNKYSDIFGKADSVNKTVFPRLRTDTPGLLFSRLYHILPVVLLTMPLMLVCCSQTMLLIWIVKL